MSNKNPIIYSSLLSTWTLVTLWWIFSLPITLSLWLSSWILIWSYFIFKWFEDKIYDEKIKLIKKEVIDINVEISINNRYLEEYKEYFFEDSKDIKNIEKYVDFLVFKNIFFSTNIEKKLYKIKNDISNIFLIIDNNFLNSKIEQKEKALNNLTEINDIKSELNKLLRNIKKDISLFMKQTLDSINEAKIELEKIDKKDIAIQKNITILETHYNLLKKKIEEFDLNQ